MTPKTWRDEPGMLAWSALLRAHAATVPLVDARLRAEVGLKATWYDVLLELNAAPRRRLRMQELGETVVLSRTRVSRVVDELSRAGLVERQANADDGRSAFAVITGEGRRVLRRAAPAYLQAVRDCFVSAIDPAQLDDVIRALKAVAEQPSRSISGAGGI